MYFIKVHGETVHTNRSIIGLNNPPKLFYQTLKNHAQKLI